MLKKVVIFDFDGTLADTFRELIELGNRRLAKLGRPEVKEGIKKLRTYSLKEIFSKFGVLRTKLPFFVRRYRSWINKRISSLKPPVKNLQNSLRQLKRDGFVLGVLTSNSEKNVKTFLKRNNLDYFDFINSERTVFGKQVALKRIIKKHNFRSKQLIYVGDETRNIEAAKKAKISIIAVSWGFNSKKILKKFKPNALVDTPAQLIPAIKGI